MGSRQSAGVGKIFIKYEDAESAKKALQALAGRKFADRTVVTTYFDEVCFPRNQSGAKLAMNANTCVNRPASMLMLGEEMSTDVSGLAACRVPGRRLRTATKRVGQLLRFRIRPAECEIP
jgi:hypothetical protein